jgi:hypothetical protein
MSRLGMLSKAHYPNAQMPALKAKYSRLMVVERRQSVVCVSQHE